MFEKASRLKLRFAYRGQCSVEDLWDLPLMALDDIYKQLNRQLKTETEESLLNKRSAADELLDLQIRIVKYIVEVRLAEQEVRKNAATKAVQKEKILAVIAEKQDAALYDKPVEELMALVNNLIQVQFGFAKMRCEEFAAYAETQGCTVENTTTPWGLWVMEVELI